MTRLVPLQMRRRGVETRLVLPGEAVAVPRTDPALLRALARGYQWFGELAAGTAVSTRQIAAREGVSDSYVRHLVPLALLAPAIVESHLCRAARRLPLRRASEDSGWCSDRMGRPAAALCRLESRASSLPTTKDHRSSERRSVRARSDRIRSWHRISSRTERNRVRIGDLPDWSRSPLPRAVRNRPQGRVF